MTGQTWKRQKLEELRTRIKIEEHILRALRAELEELQWLDRKSAEIRCGWDIALTAEEQDIRHVEAEFVEIWLAGEHKLKGKSPDVPAEAQLINISVDSITTVLVSVVYIVFSLAHNYVVL